MSRPQPPHKPKEPPIYDNPTLETIYANEVASIFHRNGVVTFVLAEERPTTDDPPKMERRVVARYALPVDAVEKMMNSLLQMSQASGGGLRQNPSFKPAGTA